MTVTWHAITCRTCGEVLASGLMPEGCEQTAMYLHAFQDAHRVVDGCEAEHVVLAPCSDAEVEARLQADLDRERAS